MPFLRKLREQGWGTRLKRQRKDGEEKKTKQDIHILWIKSPRKGAAVARPTIDRIFNAVNVHFNIYSNRKIEPQVQK